MHHHCAVVREIKTEKKQKEAPQTVMRYRQSSGLTRLKVTDNLLMPETWQPGAS